MSKPTQLSPLDKRHSVSIAFPVNVAEDTLVKQAVQVHEHRHNVKEGLLEKSKLAQHAFEKGHKVDWDEDRILEIESNTRYRKYKESAYMACLTSPMLFS